VEAAALAVMSDVASIDVTELAGGSSAFVALLHLCSHNEVTQTVVFRQHVDKVGKGERADAAAKEFHLTRRLRDRGMSVPGPLVLCDTGYTEGPWLVTEVVPGRNATGMMGHAALVDEMADFLACLHALDPRQLEVRGLELIEDPVTALPRYLPADAVGERVRRELNAGVRRGPNDVRLLHGDFWPGNVMVRDGRVEAVLDWEDAKLGDPLADLACARVEITCDGGEHAAERFTTTYCRARPDAMLDDLALWDMYVSASALAGMHLWGLPPATEATRRSATHEFFVNAAARFISGQ
jgi:aminoglycoside phosphotransferase (APT) family kinase protein